MEAIVERCCGLDVHQASVVACVLVGRADQKPRKEVRTFKTFTQDLLALREWLSEMRCTHVGMESTGVYWRPVYAMLEGSFELIVGNAHHIKNVPGRKTDVKDSEWIADLVRHGLIAKSFVPPKPIRELRDLMRYRRKLVESRTHERNRVLKLLEVANIKVSSVATDVFGKSGRLMLAALAKGDATAEATADLAQGLLRKKLPELRAALEGRLDEHHRFLLRLQLDRLDHVEADLVRLDAYIDGKLAPYREQQQALQEIPGVGSLGAAVILSEIGPDMDAFRSDHHLAAWAGVTPGNNQTAGKKRAEQLRKGNVHLLTLLVEAAQAAVRKRGSYYRAKYYRLKAGRGAKRAIVAIAHKILLAAYHILRTSASFKELGEGYLDSLSQQRVTRQLVHRLESLGYRVQLEHLEGPPAPAALATPGAPPREA